MPSGNPLMRALLGVIASTLAGTCVVVALVSGVTGLWPLLGIAAIGAIAAIPVSLIIARAMDNNT